MKCCKECICIKCYMNGVEGKSPLPKERLEIINGCMCCAICIDYDKCSGVCEGFLKDNK